MSSRFTLVSQIGSSGLIRPEKSRLSFIGLAPPCVSRVEILQGWLGQNRDCRLEVFTGHNPFIKSISTFISSIDKYLSMFNTDSIEH